MKGGTHLLLSLRSELLVELLVINSLSQTPCLKLLVELLVTNPRILTCWFTPRRRASSTQRRHARTGVPRAPSPIRPPLFLVFLAAVSWQQHKAKAISSSRNIPTLHPQRRRRGKGGQGGKIRPARVLEDIPEVEIAVLRLLITLDTWWFLSPTRDEEPWAEEPQSLGYYHKHPKEELE